ncbi:MAG: thiamine pyrophosphate-dependent enzyme [Methanobacteriota archaeon]
MTDNRTGEQVLAESIKACADRVYAVPGYPISGLTATIGATLVINEKVALEYAIGESLEGRRSCVIVKHVGMNALVDPLVHATFQGLIGGVVIICGDDETAKNTMTVQDSRTFGPVAAVPVLEGISSSQVMSAFQASERYSRVALLRVTSKSLSNTYQVDGDTEARQNCSPMRQGSLADSDLTMYGRAVRVKGEAYLMNASGLVPLPIPPFTLSTAPVRRKERGYALALCAGCPFRGMFQLMHEKGLSAICDTGCSLIAMNPPYSFGLASYGMGSAIAVGVRSTQVALLGDYALLHSGIQALIEAYEYNFPLLCIVMVNGCMGMTGGQPTPDPTPYISFAHPIRCDAADLASLDQLLTIPDRPVTILVYGRCPEVINHETVAC